MLTRQLNADTLGVPSSDPGGSAAFRAMGGGGGAPVWLRVAVALLCISHGAGVVVGLVKGGSLLWSAAFGAFMIGVLVVMMIQRRVGLRPD